MSIYKQTLHNAFVSRKTIAIKIAEALPTSQASAYRIIKGKKKLTIDEALKIKVILNDAIGKMTEVAANI